MKTKILILEIISCLLLAVSSALFFTGWISINEDTEIDLKMGDFLGEIDNISDAIEEYEDADRDELLDEIEEAFDEKGIKIKPKRFLEVIDKLFDVFEDKQISPYEYTKLGSVSSDFFDFIPEDEMDDDATIGLQVIKWGTLIPSILFYAILAFNALTLVLHIFHRKSCGYFNTFLTLVMAGASMLVVLLFNVGISAGSGEPEPSLSSYLQLSVMPYITFACSLVSGIFWSVAKRKRHSYNLAQSVAMNSQPQMNPYQPQMNQYQPQMNQYQPQMNQYQPQMNQYQPQMNQYQSQTEQPVEQYQSEPTQALFGGGTRYCNQCGASIPNDVKFCPTCGTQLF